MGPKPLHEELAELLGFFCLYHKEGIVFTFVTEKRTPLSMRDKIIYGYPIDSDPYLTEAITNEADQTLLVRKFYTKRWQTESHLYTEQRFLKKELEYLNSFSKKVIDFYKFQTYPAVKFLEESIAKGSKMKFKVEVRKTSFDDLIETFHDINTAKFCFSLLLNVSPPIVTDKDTYALGERSKGSLTAWVQVLRVNSLIKGLDDEELAPLLNKKFKELNLGPDGRTLRNLGTTAYKRYYTQFQELLKDFIQRS